MTLTDQTEPKPVIPACPNCGTPGRLTPIAVHHSPRSGYLDIEFKCAACGVVVVHTQKDEGA